jgi:RimJ/RimL family protein N-acetyltransferase
MSQKQQQLTVSIRPWSGSDLALLERLMGDPARAGTGALDQIRARHESYLQSGETSRQGPMFAITVGPDGQAVGSIGYWHQICKGEHLWEVGWSVLPEYQGQGIANRAIQLIAAHARSLGKTRFLHAFPAVDNQAANAICREAEFELLGEVDLDYYPAGHNVRRNDWRLEILKAMG